MPLGFGLGAMHREPERGPERTMPQDTNVVSRVMTLLAVFCEGPPAMSLKDIAGRSGLAPSTAHRLLQPLVRMGVVERAPGRQYCIGAEFVRMAMALNQRLPLLEAASPVMREIVRQTAKTCFLYIYLPRRGERMAIACTKAPETENEIRINVFDSFPLAWGASGRAILAHLPQREIDNVLSRSKPSPLDGSRLPERSRMLDLLGRIREQGYAVTEGQIRAANKMNMAAPILGEGQRVLGNLALVTLRESWSGDLETRLSPFLIDQSRMLASRLAAVSA